MSIGEILVIDDDELILQLAQAVLQEGGFDVVTTADGPQGIELYRVRRPDVVLLDLGLPSMNGMQVLAELRRLDMKARVIVLTGYDSNRTIEEAMSKGALDVLAKPFHAKHLIEKVRLAMVT